MIPNKEKVILTISINFPEIAKELCEAFHNSLTKNDKVMTDDDFQQFIFGMVRGCLKNLAPNFLNPITIDKMVMDFDEMNEKHTRLIF